MPLGSGFGQSGPYGVDPWGQTNFARKILLENLPQVYVEADLDNDDIFTKFIQGLFPNTNEFRNLLDRFPDIRDPEAIPPDAIDLLVILNDLQTEIQIVGPTLPLVVVGNQITITGENPAETITVAVVGVENDLSRIVVGTPFPFATSIRTVRVVDTIYPFLVTNGSPYLYAVPDIFPDVAVGDFILIGDVRSVVTKITPDLFKFETIPSPSVSPTPVRTTITRLSRLVLLTLLAKDFGLIDDPTKLEAVRRGLVLHAVELFKLKGTAKGYTARGAIEGLKVDVSNFQEVPCAKTLADVIPIAIGTIQAIDGSLIEAGEGIVLSDVAHGARQIEFTKGGTGKTAFLTNDANGAGGNAAITTTVANPGFKVFGMSGGFTNGPARGAIVAVDGALIADGETFTLTDGVNPPTVFEFDKNGITTPGNIPVVINNGMSATQVMAQIAVGINSVAGPLAITASVGVTLEVPNSYSAIEVAVAIADAINGFAPYDVTAEANGAIVDVRNDVDGLSGVLPLFEWVTDAGFIVNGMDPYNGISLGTPTRTLDPIPYISGFDVVPTDTIPVDSPSFRKYFDVGNFDTGQITAIPGIQIGEAETFTLYDDENPPTVFEFDKDGITTTGRVPVPITDAMNADAVAAAIRTAINGVFMSLRITATHPAFTPIVNLRMDTPSGHVQPSYDTVPGVEILDTEKFTLSDEVNTPTTFEYDKNGSVTMGNIPVPINDMMTAEDVAIAVANAVNAVGASLLLIATPVGAQVQMVKNVTIRDTVIDPGFITAGMSGGTSALTEYFPVLYPTNNQFFTIAGCQFTYNPGPGANQITTLSVCDLQVGDIVEFGLQQRTVTAVPGVSPMPEFPGLRNAGVVIDFDLPLIGLTPNSSAYRVTRAPDISTFNDFLTIAGFDYKVVQYNSSSFSGASDFTLRDVALVGSIQVAARTRRRAVTRRAAYDFCRLPILKLRMELVPSSIFYSGFESALKFVKALDEMRPIHVRFEDVEFVQEETIVVPIPNVTATSNISAEPVVAVDNYYDSMAAEDTPADSTKVVTVETP
jgi:hypothetical protein